MANQLKMSFKDGLEDNSKYWNTSFQEIWDAPSLLLVDLIFHTRINHYHQSQQWVKIYLKSFMNHILKIPYRLEIVINKIFKKLPLNLVANSLTK